MLKKFLSIVGVVALSSVFVGCEPATDTTPDTTVPTTDTEAPAVDGAAATEVPTEPAPETPTN